MLPHALLSDVPQRLTLREIPSKKPVGSVLPGMLGGLKRGFHTDLLFNLVVVECAGHDQVILSMTWTRALNGATSRTTRNEAQTVLGASEVARQFVASGDGSFVLPVIAYYSTDRLWAQVPKKDLSKEDFSSSRTKGYEQALHASANSARIVSWFRKLSLWEWQNKKKSPEYNAVKKGVGKAFRSASGYDNGCVDYDAEIENIVVEYVDGCGGAHRDPLNSMSDGYRGTLNLVADIARRMAMLNPALCDKVLEAPGVVMIDEIDLHLHPKWQAKILGDLADIFPNVQFIVTTHSPIVVASVPRENVRMLDDERAVVPPRLKHTGMIPTRFLLRFLRRLPVLRLWRHCLRPFIRILIKGNMRPPEKFLIR